MASASARPRIAGFTLIEVLAAFVILALSLAALLPALSGSLRADRASSDLVIATAYAQSLIAGVGVNGRIAEGEFANTLERRRFHSLLKVRPMNGSVGREDGPKLYKVTARVAWRAGLRERTVTLTTARFAGSGQK